MIKLKEARQLRNLSQMELKKKSKIHAATISYIERDLLTARPEQRAALEMALDMRGLIKWEEEG